MPNTTLRTAPAATGRLGRLVQRARSDGISALARHLRIVAMQRGHDVAEQFLIGGADPTRGKRELSELTITSTNASAGVHYLPTPWAVLTAIHNALPIDPTEWTFLDLGTGRGRAVLSAAERPYARVVGVEFAAELAAEARAAIAAAGYSAPRVDIVEGDAAAVALPPGQLVVFLFNPFGPVVLRPVLAALARHPAPVLVVYVNPVHEAILANHPAFTRVGLRLADRIRLGLMSPYRVSLFSTDRART
jgi:SAM-dependent methyltransferase